MMEVFSLAGRAHFECTVICLESFVRHHLDDCELRVLSDGTLTSEEVNRLERIPGCRVVHSEPFQAEIAEVLDGHERLKQVHAEHFYFKKLIDIPVIAGRTMFRYIDSDIYFWRDFRGLFRATNEGPRIMAEDISVSAGLRDLWRWQVPIHARSNSGVLQGPMVEPELAECLLLKMVDTRRHVWEQAIYGAAWGSERVELITRDIIYLPHRGVRVPTHLASGSTIGMHLAGDRKGLVHELVAKRLSSLYDTPLSLRKRSVGPHHPVTSMALKVLSRLFRPA